MKACLKISGIVLGVCASVMAESPGPRTSQESDVRTFHIKAVAPPTPALKHQLLFDPVDRVAGNAAVSYLDAVLLASPDAAEKADKALAAYEAKDTRTFEQIVDSMDLAPMLEELDLAGRRKDCDWNSPVREKGARTLLPHLAPLRNTVAKLVRVKALRQMQQGKVDDALKTLRLGYELSDKAGRESGLISRLVAISITRWMNDGLSEVMDRPDSPNLYWALATVPAREPMLREVWRDCEVDLLATVPKLSRVRGGEGLSPAEWRAVMVDDMDLYYRVWEGPEAGKTRARPDPVKDASTETRKKALQQYAAAHRLTAEQAGQVNPAVALGNFYFGQYESACQDWEKLSGLSYPTLLERNRQQNAAVEKLRAAQPSNPFLVEVTTPDRAVWAFARTDRQLAALTAVEALRSYAAAHAGSLPKQLADVIDTPVPQNPVTGKAFEYRLENGTATLADSQSPETLRYTIAIRN